MLNIALDYLGTKIISHNPSTSTIPKPFKYRIEISVYPGDSNNHTFISIQYGLDDVAFIIETRFAVIGIDKGQLANSQNPSTKKIIAELLFFTHAQLIVLVKEKLLYLETNVSVPMKFINDFANITITIQNWN